jgi:hypothetical protein
MATVRFPSGLGRLFLRTSLRDLVRGLAPRELLPLGLAVFALFAVMGPMTDVIGGARQPLFIVLATSLA